MTLSVKIERRQLKNSYLVPFRRCKINKGPSFLRFSTISHYLYLICLRNHCSTSLQIFSKLVLCLTDGILSNLYT